MSRKYSSWEIFASVIRYTSDAIAIASTRKLWPCLFVELGGAFGHEGKISGFRVEFENFRVLIVFTIHSKAIIIELITTTGVLQYSVATLY